MFPWHQYVLGLIFLIAGVTHFTKSHWYERIIPPYIPAHKEVVAVSGIAEMIVGFMLLNADTQQMAAYAIMGLLILFFPVHIHMLRNEKASLNLPKWLLILRIPIQFGLIYWAYQYV
ncbi:hypothetical protein POV27_10715 [Aureisphaera galaxeae]|uniref:DoxX family protein n=1 Tax=Aureisphaera galaxeae TaxID=1538023 RepID=UPI0023505A3D|nr:hypothetical protein [Aureisphaera galaxeae]MDC8004520.1 hypothetical protein [Aureisphaera galaxeae]